MKAQVVLPESLFAELKQVVPIRKRSQFIAEAVGARLKALRFQQAVKSAQGSWTDRNHPSLRTQADINRFLARFRRRLSRRG